MKTLISLSLKNNCFLWLPPKTGTSHATFIFKHFDFSTYTLEDGKIIDKSELRHHHNISLFPEHEKHKIICTARNPFDRYISYYKFQKKHEKNDISVDNFRKYFHEMVKENDLKNFFSLTNLRVPDYFLRLENLWSDYNKIPFIRNSKLNQSGILYELCQKKLNPSFETELNSKFYTNEMIDFMLNEGKKYFELLGYSYPY